MVANTLIACVAVVNTGFAFCPDATPIAPSMV